jgi:hypothetical protein
MKFLISPKLKSIFFNKQNLIFHCPYTFKYFFEKKQRGNKFLILLSILTGLAKIIFQNTLLIKKCLTCFLIFAVIEKLRNYHLKKGKLTKQEK